jgi:hypothetical protein
VPVDDVQQLRAVVKQSKQVSSTASSDNSSTTFNTTSLSCHPLRYALYLKSV